MTLTSNCTSFLIDSLSFTPANLSLSLSVSYQKGTPVVFSIPNTATDFTILPTQLGMTSFKDGVYSFTLSITHADSSVSTETLCHYSDCTDTCKLTFKATDKDSMNKALALIALKLSANCDSCRCDDLADLYTYTQEPACNDCTCGCK